MCFYYLHQIRPAYLHLRAVRRFRIDIRSVRDGGKLVHLNICIACHNFSIFRALFFHHLNPHAQQVRIQRFYVTAEASGNVCLGASLPQHPEDGLLAAVQHVVAGKGWLAMAMTVGFGLAENVRRAVGHGQENDLAVLGAPRYRGWDGNGRYNRERTACDIQPRAEQVALQGGVCAAYAAAYLRLCATIFSHGAYEVGVPVQLMPGVASPCLSSKLQPQGTAAGKGFLGALQMSDRSISDASEKAKAMI